MTKSRWNVVVGLTGGLGSGKSTVLGMFKRQGAFTLDADQIVHRAYRDKKVLRKLKKSFGAEIFNGNGSLDKKNLAALVFSSTRQRRRLEKMIHPVVRRKMASELSRHRGAVAVCDVPLLYESGLQKYYDRVVVVKASRRARLKRLKIRGVALAEARRRFKAQWPLRRKIKKADFVIDNDGSLIKTKKQVKYIYDALTGGLL